MKRAGNMVMSLYLILIVGIECISTNVVLLIYNENLLIKLRRYSLR